MFTTLKKCILHRSPYITALHGGERFIQRLQGLFGHAPHKPNRRPSDRMNSHSTGTGKKTIIIVSNVFVLPIDDLSDNVEQSTSHIRHVQKSFKTFTNLVKRDWTIKVLLYFWLSAQTLTEDVYVTALISNILLVTNNLVA